MARFFCSCVCVIYVWYSEKSNRQASSRAKDVENMAARREASLCFWRNIMMPNLRHASERLHHLKVSVMCCMARFFVRP